MFFYSFPTGEHNHFDAEISKKLFIQNFGQRLLEKNTQLFYQVFRIMFLHS